MSNQPSKNSRVVAPILVFIVVISSTLFLIQVGDTVINLLNLNLGLATPAQEPIESIPAPADEIPAIIDEPQATTTKVTITPSRAATANPFTSSDSYRAASVLVAVDGEFSYAHLIATTDGPVSPSGFLSLAFGYVSGNLNTVRLSQSTLDVGATAVAGGLLSGHSVVDIDLLGETVLSSTAKEFVTTKNPTKTVRLWDAIQPPSPSAVRVVAAPFDEHGSFASYKLSKLEIEYACVTGSKCGIALCKDTDLTTQCLARSFGVRAAESWKQRYRPPETAPKTTTSTQTQ